MDLTKPFGIQLYQKERKDYHVLKDLLQLLKSQTKGKNVSFAYVEANTSLIPDLTLWENLQIVTGGTSWEEAEATLKPEYAALFRLIRNPDTMSQEVEAWERFCLSLLKGILSPAHSLLVDMDEDLFSPLMVQNFKKTFLSLASERKIYLASATSALWLDCAHSIVTRSNFEFVTEELDQELLKRHWVA
jgi:ABC-type branched-subunit amino acid transport system ATPase component